MGAQAFCPKSFAICLKRSRYTDKTALPKTPIVRFQHLDPKPSVYRERGARCRLERSQHVDNSRNLGIGNDNTGDQERNYRTSGTNDREIRNSAQ